MTKLFFTLLVMLALPLYGNALIQRSAARKPTISLQITVKNRVLREGETLLVKAGQSIQLNVQAVRKDGSKTDVSHDPKTQFFSLTPSIISVTDTGVVTISSSPELNSAKDDQDVGIIGISYGSSEDTEVGIATLFIEIDDQTAKATAVDLLARASSRVLRVGETAQISVIEKRADGSTSDLTSAATGTTYETTSESSLIPEPDGRVTCIGTQGEDRKFAAIVVYNGNRHKKIFFELRIDGPGPSLEVVADKTVLRVGEQVQLHVYKSLPDGSRKDLTTTANGTRYLTFPGFGVVSQDVIRISQSGLASAADSIGGYNARTVIVFVRNADSVAWIQLRVNHANS
jgi:hypothetical protein